MESPKKTTSDFEFGGTIDIGTFSTVAAVTEKSSQLQYAAKIVSKKSMVLNRMDPTSAIREKELLLLCKEHQLPSIVTLHYTFQDEYNLYYVMTLGQNGNLKSYWRSHSPIEANTKLLWLKQIFLAVSALHSLNILHGDIKPENCVLDADLKVFLCDFNSAHQLEDHIAIVSTSNSSASFMSPESISGSGRGLSSDVWALGILAFELFTDELPFKAETEYLTLQRVAAGHFSWSAPLVSEEERNKHITTNSLDQDIYTHISDLISRCLDSNPKTRITAAKACNHIVFDLLCTK